MYSSVPHCFLSSLPCIKVRPEMNASRHSSACLIIYTVDFQPPRHLVCLWVILTFTKQLGIMEPTKQLGGKTGAARVPKHHMFELQVASFPDQVNSRFRAPRQQIFEFTMWAKEFVLIKRWSCPSIAMNEKLEKKLVAKDQRINQLLRESIYWAKRLYNLRVAPLNISNIPQHLAFLPGSLSCQAPDVQLVAVHCPPLRDHSIHHPVHRPFHHQVNCL